MLILDFLLGRNYKFIIVLLTRFDFFDKNVTDDACQSLCSLLQVRIYGRHVWQTLLFCRIDFSLYKASNHIKQNLKHFFNQQIKKNLEVQLNNVKDILGILFSSSNHLEQVLLQSRLKSRLTETTSRSKYVEKE
jgi:hypothetical protein